MTTRRNFITLVGGAVTAWPVLAQGQQSKRVRRIGVLLPATADDLEYQPRIRAFLQALEQFGWRVGRNVQIEMRWATVNPDAIRRSAAELVALAPDVILAHGTATVAPLVQATHTIPIVFPIAGDPVATGFADSLARPGGNVTGFMTVEMSMGGKWLELLKQIAPVITRVAVLRDAGLPQGMGQFGAAQTAAGSLGVALTPVNVRDASEIERAIAAFARSANGGLIVTANPSVQFHRDLIVKLAARHKLPAIYFQRSFVDRGGLCSYGPDFIDQYRRAAGYVDRILNGEKPGDLPVQAPTKLDLIINLKTAKALGLTVPATLLARADEVIE